MNEATNSGLVKGFAFCSPVTYYVAVQVYFFLLSSIWKGSNQCSHQDWRSEGHILADQLHVRAAWKNVYPIYPVKCYCCQHFYINLFSQTSQTVQVVLKHQK